MSLRIDSADGSHCGIVTPETKGVLVEIWQLRPSKTRLGSWCLDNQPWHRVLDEVYQLVWPLTPDPGRYPLVKVYDPRLGRVVTISRKE